MNTTTDRATDRPAATHEASLSLGGDRWLVLRHRLRIDGVAALTIGGAFFIAVTVITIVVAIRNDIQISGWQVGTHVVRWFVGAIGVYLTAVHLPLYVVHGRTRAEVARQMAVFGALYAVVVGVIVTVGFVLEGLVYALADWPQALMGSHLYDAPDQYHLILLEHTLLFGAWLAAGALLGAAFYRSGAIGGVMLPLAVAAVAITESVVGPGYFGPLPSPLLEIAGLGEGAAGPVLATAATVVCLVVAGAGTWLVVRDVPIRPGSS